MFLHVCHTCMLRAGDVLHDQLQKDVQENAAVGDTEAVERRVRQTLLMEQLYCKAKLLNRLTYQAADPAIEPLSLPIPPS
jgi:hypothetical protein